MNSTTRDKGTDMGPERVITYFPDKYNCKTNTNPTISNFISARKPPSVHKKQSFEVEIWRS